MREWLENEDKFQWQDIAKRPQQVKGYWLQWNSSDIRDETAENVCTGLLKVFHNSRSRGHYGITRNLAKLPESTIGLTAVTMWRMV